jgi:hypothetical protein
MSFALQLGLLVVQNLTDAAPAQGGDGIAPEHGAHHPAQGDPGQIGQGDEGMRRP